MYNFKEWLELREDYGSRYIKSSIIDFFNHNPHFADRQITKELRKLGYNVSFQQVVKELDPIRRNMDQNKNFQNMVAQDYRNHQIRNILKDDPDKPKKRPLYLSPDTHVDAYDSPEITNFGIKAPETDRQIHGVLNAMPRGSRHVIKKKVTDD